MPNAERQMPNENKKTTPASASGISNSAFGIRHSAFSALSLLDLLVVAGLCLLINGYRIGQGPLAGTEANRALAAHAMVQSGDWVLPKLYGQLYLKKPPLHYWILAAAEKLTGRADVGVWRWPSVIEATLTALFLQLMTWRWFGRLAGLVSGLLFCDMFCLWMQNRTAEVDALNTMFCVMAGCCMVEMLARCRGTLLSPSPGTPGEGWGGGLPASQSGTLHKEPPPQSSPWVQGEEEKMSCWLPVGLSLAFAGITMTKGPAGYTVVFAALAAMPIAVLSFRVWKMPRLWLALLAGLIPIAIYGVVAYRTAKIQGIVPDWSGVQEVYEGRHDVIRAIKEIVTLIVSLPMYAFPAILSLLFVLHPSIWRSSGQEHGEAFGDGQRRIVRGLVLTTAFAAVFSLCTGLLNPRYSYLWLPLFCPLAGAVVAAWRAGILPKCGFPPPPVLRGRAGVGVDRLTTLPTGKCKMPPTLALPRSTGGGDDSRIPSELFHSQRFGHRQWGEEWLKLCLAIVAGTQTAAALGFTYMAIHRGSDARMLLCSVCGLCAIGSIIAGVLVHYRRLATAGIVIIPLIALLAIPCAEYGVRDRLHRSHQSTGIALAAQVPPGTVVLTQNVLWDQPEVFYYAKGVGVEALPPFGRIGSQPPAAVTEGRWLVLNELEREQWKQFQDVSLGENIKLHNDPTIILTRIEGRKH